MKKAIFLLLFLFTFSCRKETSDPTNPKRTEGFTVSKTSVVPSEMLLLTLEKQSDEKMLELEFGGQKFSAAQIEGSSYGFLVPESLTAGIYDLRLKDGTKKAAITVGSSPSISNPDTYLKDFVQLSVVQFRRVQSMQDTLVKAGLLSASTVSEERNVLSKRLEDVNNHFNALSAPEKLALARFIAANRAGIDAIHTELRLLDTIGGPESGRVIAECSKSPRDEYTKCISARLRKLNADIVMEFTLMIVSLELGQPAFAAAFGILYLMDLYLLKGINESFVDLPSINIGEEPEIVETPSSVTKEYKNGVAKQIAFRYMLMNIHRNLDRKLADIDIQNFIASLEALNSRLSGKLGEIFPVKFNLPAMRKERILPELADRVSVTVLNNTKVKATINGFKNGLFNLAFTSSEKSEQSFDYKVSYQYAGNAIEKTVVNSKLVPDDGADLSDCTIKSTDGEPISKPGVTDKQYRFTLEGTCKFPPKTLFFWDFGDGDTDEAVDNPTAYHKFTKNGEFTVKVRVLAEGAAEYVMREVKVKIGISDDTGPEYFTYKVNGEEYSFSDPRTSFVTSPINQGLYINEIHYNAGYKVVIGRGWDDNHRWIYMGVIASKHLVEGNYPLTKPEKDQPPSLGIVAFGSGSNRYADSGTLTITRRDNTWIEGNFSFNVGSFSVTEGKFRIKLI